MRGHNSITLDSPASSERRPAPQRGLFPTDSEKSLGRTTDGPLDTSPQRGSRIDLLGEEQTRQSLQKARDTLEQRAEDAEVELEVQRLLYLRADRLRSLGQLAAGMAHELNQPLVGVRGIAEHLLIGVTRGWDFNNEKLRKKLSLIIEQADRMSHIIQRVRMFARDAGKPETSLCRVNDVVTTTVSMLGPQLRTRGVNLDCELAEAISLVHVNPMSLEEVLLNLVFNAADAVTELTGNPATSALQGILVRTQTDRDNNLALIQVIDRGVGIPENLLDKVFEPFLTTKGPDRGTGLGLAICKDLVGQMDGKIRIESTLGRGTTVTVSLPAASDTFVV